MTNVVKFKPRAKRGKHSVQQAAATRCNWTIRFSNGYIANLEHALWAGSDVLSNKQKRAIRAAIRRAEVLVSQMKVDMYG